MGMKLITEWMVQWTDSIYTVDGAIKTRIFQYEEPAVDFAIAMQKRPEGGIVGMKVVKRKVSITEEQIYG